MKGLGAVFVVLVMALAGIGAGYATFYDKVTIHGIAKSGHLKVGIEADGTDDSSYDDGYRNFCPFYNWDPFYDTTTRRVISSHFNIAYTDMKNTGRGIFTIGDHTFHKKVELKTMKIFENYAPTISMFIGVKDDSVPAKVCGLTMDFTEKNLSSHSVVAKGNVTVDMEGQYHYTFTTTLEENTIIYNGEDRPNFEVVSYRIRDAEGQELYIGSSLQSLMENLSKITLSPGTYIQIELTIRFTNVPPDHKLTGDLSINYKDYYFND